jgi:hypothetical protein
MKARAAHSHGWLVGIAVVFGLVYSFAPERIGRWMDRFAVLERPR